MTTSNEISAGWITLAHLLRPQGRKGEVLAELFTDFPEQFDDRNRVFLAKPGFTGTEEEARAISVVSHWLPVGRNHGRIVLGFEGIDSINKAEELGGLDVLIPASERVELEDDSEYVSDLIGCVVYDNGIAVGTVTDVPDRGGHARIVGAGRHHQRLSNLAGRPRRHPLDDVASEHLHPGRVDAVIVR